jgi:hypothetical protein
MILKKIEQDELSNITQKFNGVNGLKSGGNIYVIGNKISRLSLD